MDQTWTIVEFEDESTVEAVPTSWIRGDQCVWPPFSNKEKITNAIKNCDLNTHWPSLKIRTFKDSTFDNYSVARLKAKQAEETSDLNSDLDKRRRTKKKRPLSCDSESELSDDTIIKPKTINKLPPPPKKLLNTGVATTSVAKSTSSHSPAILGNCIKSCICCQEKQDVTRSLFVIKNICCEILTKVDGLLNSKNQLQMELETPILTQININLPIATQDDLDSFEHFFSKEEQFLQLVLMFSKIGGDNISEFVKRCLAPIITDGLAEKFSFLGRKQKQNFSSLYLSKAVIEGAEKTKLGTTKKESEHAIASWLKRAKARMDIKQKPNLL